MLKLGFTAIYAVENDAGSEFAADVAELFQSTGFYVLSRCNDTPPGITVLCRKISFPKVREVLKLKPIIFFVILAALCFLVPKYAILIIFFTILIEFFSSMFDLDEVMRLAHIRSADKIFLAFRHAFLRLFIVREFVVISAEMHSAEPETFKLYINAFDNLEASDYINEQRILLVDNLIMEKYYGKIRKYYATTNIASLMDPRIHV